MSENVGTAEVPARKASDSPAQLGNPPLWSPWNFQTKQHDLHEMTYDEMRSNYIKNANT
jgi:hypothetical protein